MKMQLMTGVACAALMLSATTARSAGWGYSVFGASPKGEVVVPLNTRLWAMDHVENESVESPNLTECDDPDGDLVDCTGRLHTLMLLGTKPERSGSLLRLYQGEDFTLEPEHTFGFWITDTNNLRQEVRWTVSAVEDTTPPPPPVLFSARSGFDFEDGSSSPTDIPFVTTWRWMTLTAEGDDFGVAYIEIQVEDGTVVGWAFSGRYSDRFSWSDYSGSGPYRAIAVDYAGNRSEESELIVVPGQPDPYEASCLEGSIYNDWCYIMFPELLGEDDAGPGESTSAAVVRCSCDQKASRPHPMVAIFTLLLLPFSLRRRRSTQQHGVAK